MHPPYVRDGLAVYASVPASQCSSCPTRTPPLSLAIAPSRQSLKGLRPQYRLLFERYSPLAPKKERGPGLYTCSGLSILLALP